ncbi:MAG: signal transduction histidine kinase/ligand-binding sensor domain-containing protein [Phenylobacterium sp.]|jgi:signal transduction histidine kinase/ligand-binding sensor domain-containing protein
MRLIITLILALLWLLSSFITVASSAFSTRFDRLSLEHGLSQTTVYSIIQDHKGFLWFATADGLNRYDGYTFKVFRHDPADSSSLSYNDIATLTIDSAGVLWIGTNGGGLNRYDPDTESFSRFSANTSAPDNLNHNRVKRIVEDSPGQYWIATYGGGLDHFNPSTGKFIHYHHDADNPDSIASNSIRSLYQDSKGILWIGTADAGLDRFNPQSQTFSHFQHNPSDPLSLSNNAIYDITEDHQGFIWIGTNAGLNRFDSAKESFTRFTHQEVDPGSLSANKISTVFVDSHGTLWVGTVGGGLNRYHRDSDNFSHFRYQVEDLNSLGDDMVRSMGEDNQGGLWIGTRAAGLSKITPQRQAFGHVKQGLSHNTIRAIYKNAEGVLWVGTADGLNKAANVSSTAGFTHFKHQNANTNSLSSNFILAIAQDAEQDLWLGIGNDGGLNRYNPATGAFKHFKNNPSDSSSLSNDSVLSLFLSKHNNNSKNSKDILWVGTYGGGLNRYDRQTQSFVRFKHHSEDPYSLSNNFVRSMTQDSDGALWVGTYSGLNRFDNHTNGFVSYHHQASDPDSLSNDHIFSLYQDSKDTLWIGTLGGLNKFDRQANQFSHYSEKHGLANDSVYGIVEDNQGLLWLSTNKGLSRFDPETEVFRNFDVNDGLQSNEFSMGAYFKSVDGELFFGGINGFNRFFPKNLKQDKQPPIVVLTDFLLANQSVAVSNPLINSPLNDPQFSLSKSIDNLSHLILTHQQNLITFEFATLHFTNPMKNQYAYQLEGQDNTWIYTDAKNRRATYTNLPAGDYTLRIKASNHHGYWNDQDPQKSLTITVLPPLWKTWWAYSIYALLVALVMAAIVAIFVRIEQQKLLALRQVDKLKDEFLANTSHELRTPLNGIIGLAESLMDGIAGPLPDSANHNLAMVVASGRRLANLVNDILDFSKLKNRNLVLVTQAVDLYSLTEIVLVLSRLLIGNKDGNKSLKLINNISQNLPAVKADEDRLMQILNNLVGNAIKFTEHGSVTLSAVFNDKEFSDKELSDNGLGDKELTINITDTGIGIDPSQFASIFNSFEQIQGHTERGQSGTGLGLAVSKQLVELHGGTLRVKSTLGEGSTFSFTLATCEQQATPLTGVQSSSYSSQQRISRLSTLEQDIMAGNVVGNVMGNVEQPQINPSPQQYQFRILVVDDEPINRQVIKNMLSLQNYQLTEASGGEQALVALRDDGPFDLVLLDIMMPKVSGYEVCQQLRQTWPMNDLPVIFLTAKNQLSDLVHSFAMGGNDYLTKPVTKNELLARVETHLKLLDINKNLEQKVDERTRALQDSLSQLKETQQQLIEVEKMASLGNLVAGVAHEVNTPLGICITMVSLNLDKLATIEQQMIEGKVSRKIMDRYLAETRQTQTMVESNLHRAAQLIQTFKKVAVEQTADNCGEIIFHDYLAEIIASLKPQLVSTDSQIKISLISSGDWPFYTWPGAWWQVLSNLVENSVSHGFLNRTFGEITISATLENGSLVFVYRDNGNGMNKTTKDQVFEPFYTTARNRGSTGLGMHIVFNLVVHKIKGKISCFSEPGQGVEFRIEVAVKEA